MKTVIIVQARMGSTRLPGKVLKKVLGKPLLEYQIERLWRVKIANDVVIATTNREADQPIVDLCNSVDVPYFRGSEMDVLARYYGAAKAFNAQVVVRVTSDCPLIDPEVIDKIIQHYLNNEGKFDYVSNTLKRTYPRGMDTEVFSLKVIKEAHIEAALPPEREHVTPFIYKNSERYRLANITNLENLSHHRWTVDTPADFELVKQMLESLYPTNNSFTIKDCLGILDKYPEWVSINSKVKQKV